MDIASLRMVIDSRDVKRGKNDLDSLARQGDATERRLTGSTARASAGFAGMANVIRQAVVAIAAFKAAESFVRIADQAAQVEARIKLVTSATEDYVKVQQRVVSIANKNYQSLVATANLYAKLNPSIRAMGKSSEDAFQVVDAFGKALRIGGAAAQEAAAATMQFSQAMASGVLRGDEFNSIAEASPRILQAIADGSGYAAGELRKLAADGVLSAKLVSNALQSQLGVLTAEAERIPQTVGGAFQVLQNNLQLTIDAINKSAGVTEGLKSAIAGLSSAAQFVGGVIIGTFSAINTFVKTTDGAIGALKDTLVVAAGAAAGFAFAVNIGPIIAIASIAMTGLVAQLQLATSGMTLAALATRGMGAALAFLAAHPAIIVFATIGASIAYVNREYDKIIAKAEADKARTDQQRKTLKGLNDERERLAKIGVGMTEAQAREVEQRERFIQQLRDEQQSREVINSALRVFDENAKKRRELADATQAGERKRLDDAKKSTEAEQQAKKVAQERLRLAEEYQQQRAGYAGEIADLQAIQRLVADGLALEEARARVQLARQGALPSEIDDLLAQQAVVDRIAQREKDREEGGRLYLEVVKEINQEQLKAVELAQTAMDEFLSFDVGTLGDGFDKFSQSIAQVVTSFDKLLEAQELYEIARQKNAGDTVKLAEIELGWQKDQVRTYGNLAGAAKGFFKAGSSGYKALQAAEKTFRAFEVAMALKSLAVKLFATEAATVATLATVPVHVGAESVKAESSGVAAAISSMVGLPFPLNLAAFAATVAVIAGLGVAIGGGGGGGSRGPSASTLSGKGVGTVLGDKSAGSESIDKSFEMLAEIQRSELRVSNAMLEQLRLIKDGINGFAARIFQFRELTGAKVQGFKIPEFTLSSLRSLAPQTISVDGDFGGIKTIQDPSRIVASTTGNIAVDQLAAAEFLTFFAGSLERVTGVIKEAAPLLGSTPAKLQEALDALVLGAINIKGLKKLKGDALAERLSNIVGAQADRLVSELDLILGLGLRPFQHVGEGLQESLVRVVSGIEQASAAALRLGISTIHYTEILNKQGDVATEIIRQSVLLGDATQGITGGFYEIVSAFDGTVDEVVDLVVQLRSLQDQITATGQSAEYLTSFMIQGAGGSDRLSDGLQAYFDEFLTEGERQVELNRRLAREFGKLGLAVPTSVAEFKRLVQAIDITTTAGQELFGGIVALSPAFIEAKEAVSSLVQSLRDLRDEAARQAAATRAPGVQLASIRSQFTVQSSLAGLGNRDAAELLPELGKQFIDASRRYATSQTEYLRDLAAIQLGADRAARVQEGMPAFAAGGTHGGGWRMVGEAGPELEYTGPSRIYNANQTGSMLDTSDLRAEIQQLRQEMSAGLFAVAKNTGKTASQLQRWDGDGLPTERTEVA